MAIPATINASPYTTTPTTANNTSAVSAESIPSDVEIDSAFIHYADPETGIFDQDQAEQDGIHPFILDIAEIYNTELALGPSGQEEANGYAARAIDWAGLPITNRWKWCGRDRTNGGAPENSADRVCMNHDRCLNGGNNVCTCDRNFVNGMKNIKNSYSGLDRAYIEAAIRLVPRFHGCSV